MSNIRNLNNNKIQRKDQCMFELKELDFPNLWSHFHFPLTRNDLTLKAKIFEPKFLNMLMILLAIPLLLCPFAEFLICFFL